MDATCWTHELEAGIRSVALASGFHLAGIADADSDQAGARFEAWVEAGRAGEMDYLKRRDAEGTLLRSRLRVAIPWARSIIICAFNYDSPHPNSTDPAPPDAGWIGRYAWSGRENGKQNGKQSSQRSGPEDNLPAEPSDYHYELLGRLRAVEARLRESVPCQTLCYVDTGPIVERSFAAQAGVGWIGKNTCVINQHLGSWLLLGVIVTSLRVAASAQVEIASDRCGTCTRCIDACPTNALVAPREMDASRCIAYLTIEKKGSIDPGLRPGIGRQVFGCDICQDVCPWNVKNSKSKANSLRREDGNRIPSLSVTSGMEPRPELVNPSLAWLAGMDPQTFRRWFKGSPLERTGRKRLQRNVAIAMGNSGEPQFLPQLQQWAEGADDVLAETARWAIERIGSASIGV